MGVCVVAALFVRYAADDWEFFDITMGIALRSKGSARREYLVKNKLLDL